MPRPADTITLTALALLSVGLVMVASAGMQIGSADPVTLRSILTSPSSLYAALAVAALLVARHLPVRALADNRALTDLTPLLYPVALLFLLLTFVPALQHTAGGAARWLRVPGTGFTFQPSEIAKWALPLALAWYAAKQARSMRRFSAGLLPPLAAAALVCLLIAKEDLGTAVLIAAAACILLIASGARLAHFALVVAPVAALATAFFIYAEPYRVRRITAFLNPYDDPAGDGYHMIQSLLAIANGNGAGQGLGFGVYKFGYLPEDRTDFLFAIIAEELGVVGVAALLSLYAALLLACLATIRRETKPFLKLAAIGITATLALQTIINLFVVTGMAPTKGIALPLLSHGGTGWILTAASLGLIAAINSSQPAHTPEAEATPDDETKEPHHPARAPVPA